MIKKLSTAIKKFNIILLLITAAALHLPLSAAAGAYSAGISIDTSVVKKHTDASMYGMSGEWGSKLSNAIETADGFPVSDKFTENLAGFSLPLYRLAGSSSKYFFWKDYTGDITKRVPNEYGSGYTYLGIADWIRATRAVDADAEFMYVPNLVYDSLESLRDLAVYLTCNPGEHIGADGVDWAVRRIEDGLQKPVDIIWELGNEYDYSLSFTQQEYISLCRDAIAVIRSVDPDAKIACHADTTLVSKGLSGDDSGYLWDKAVLESLGDKIDYMIVHSYYSGSNAYKVPAVIEKVNKDILNITGENRIKVIISEHSWWASDIYSNQYKIRSMYSLGQTADYYLRLTDYPNVVSSAYHSLFADDDFVPGGILKLTALMCRYTTGDNLKTSITCNNSQYSKYVTACATEADNGINLVLNNTSVDDTYQVTVDTNLSAVKMVKMYSDGDVYGNPNSWQSDVAVSETEYLKSEGVRSFTLSPNTLMFLELR